MSDDGLAKRLKDVESDGMLLNVVLSDSVLFVATLSGDDLLDLSPSKMLQPFINSELRSLGQ